MILGPRFEEALLYATRTHALQERKGTGVPYLSHLLAVAALVLEHGADENTAIAALLHDAAEDQGGRARLEDIRLRFGQRVEELVESLTDDAPVPGQAKLPWRERKEAYLSHLADALPQTLLISAADKLHNARAILADQRAIGDAVFERFKGGKDGTLWYYRELVKRFDELLDSPLRADLARTVEQMEELAQAAVHDAQSEAARL